MGLLLLQGASDLNPRELFASGEQGLWLDPSQLSTLYQDSNGVTPCTAAGDPVGLILDQSRGGLSQIRADLVTNGTFAADSDWTKGANWTIGSGVATKTGGAANNLTQTIGSTAAAWYRISLDVTRSAGTLTVSLGTSGTTYAITATGSYTFFILAGSGTQTLTLAGDSSFAGTVDNVVVRNVPGNHAYQSSSSARPTLARIPSSGRRNVLTYTEQLDNAAWGKVLYTVAANQEVAPDGNQTADVITTSNSGGGYVRFDVAGLSQNTTYTFSFYAKRGTAPEAKYSIYDTSNSANIVASTSYYNSINSSTWTRLAYTFTTPAGCTQVQLYVMRDNIANGTTFIWGAQLETGSTATNYQKVVATTDVTESGFSDLYHLVFDGSDDSLVTNSVDFSATDEMTVIAGVRKLSDAATAMLVEMSSNVFSNNGSFNIYSTTSKRWSITSVGTIAGAADGALDSSVAPVTNVLAASFDISNDLISVRQNGSLLVTGNQDQGSGNYGNYQLFIGRRNQASLPFNGHIYQLIVRGRTTPTGKLLEAERFTARKTGVSF